MTPSVTQTPEVCALEAAILQLSDALTNAPGHTDQILALLDSAILSARACSSPVLAGDPQSLAELLARLNTLFHAARRFYTGWAALAAVSPADMLPSISVSG